MSTAEREQLENAIKAANSPLVRTVLGGAIVIATTIITCTAFVVNMQRDVAELKPLKPTVEYHTTQLAIINSHLKINSK